MKLRSCLWQFAIWFVLVCAFPALPGPSFANVPGNEEVRALWVVRTTLTSPEKIRQMVNSAADNGFNTLIVQIRGRGDAYYKSRVEPRAAELKEIGRASCRERV